MNDFSNTAAIAEKKLEKLYLILSAIALASAVILCTILFICLGFSSYSIMQSIGTILFIMFVTSAVLYFKKKSIYLHTIQALNLLSEPSEQHPDSDVITHKNITDTQQSSVTQFTQFLTEHITEYELTQNLFKTFTKK